MPYICLIYGIYKAYRYADQASARSLQGATRQEGGSTRMATISTHNGSAVSYDHNIRNRRITDKEKHIDPDGWHETWKDERPRDAYKHLFGDALKEYNSRQRDDRKIRDYYTHISRDKKKHPVYEMLVQVGSKDNPVDDKTVHAILKEFVEGWQRRNPNLYMCGAYFHADEEGGPHVHLDYIPVAHGFRKGMRTQTALVKALQEQGYTKQGKETAQVQWERSENRCLEEIVKRHGISVEHPMMEGRKHLDTASYKAQRALEEAQAELTAVKAERDRLGAHIASAKEIQGIDINRPLYGQLVHMPYQQAVMLKTTAGEADRLREELSQTRAEKYSLQMERDRMKKENDELNAFLNVSNLRKLFEEFKAQRKKKKRRNPPFR